MRRQLQGIALILFGILLNNFGSVYSGPIVAVFGLGFGIIGVAFVFEKDEEDEEDEGDKE